MIEQAIAAYHARFETTGMCENALYPGVQHALAELHEEGHRMRIVTAKPQPYAIRILEHFEIAKFFEAVHGLTLADRTHNKSILIGEALRQVASGDAVIIGDRDAGGQKYTSHTRRFEAPLEGGTVLEHKLPTFRQELGDGRNGITATWA